MIAAARGDRSKEKDGDAKQGIDFLLALVVSKWSGGHYGLTKAELKDPNSIYKTSLYKVWNGLLATYQAAFPGITLVLTTTTDGFPNFGVNTTVAATAPGLEVTERDKAHGIAAAPDIRPQLGILWDGRSRA